MINVEACKDRFLAKVDKRGPDECWPWLGGSMRFHLEGRRAIEFRRVAWILENGALKEPERRMFAICKNDRCANPRHLRYETIVDRFWSRVDRRSDHECWPWTASCVSGGYGQFRSAARVKQRAHRFSYELHNGPIPESDEELCILHRCDNPPCVNPRHLFLGTDADNIADKVAKGRQSKGPALSAAVRRARQRKAAAS